MQRNSWKDVVKTVENTGLPYLTEADSETGDVVINIPCLHLRIHTAQDYTATDTVNGTVILMNPHDPIQCIYLLQGILNLLLKAPIAERPEEDLAELARSIVLCSIVELTETLSEFAWKAHKSPNYKTLDREKALAECADVLIYLINLPIALGFSPEQFLNKIIEKQEINIKRYLSEH